MKKKLFVFLMFVLTMFAAGSVNAEEHILEFEGFNGAEELSVAEFSDASEGVYLNVDSGAELTTTFTVEEEGYYDISYVMAARINSAFSDYRDYAAVKQSIDGGDYEDLWLRESVWIKNLILKEELSGYPGGDWLDTKYHTPVFFTAGEHTVSFVFTGGKAYLDYVRIGSADLVRINDENNIVECEDFFGTQMSNEHENASGGKAVHLELATFTSFEKEFVVYVESAGEYNLEIAAANEASSIYMSPMKISVNGGTPMNIASGNFIVSDYENPAYDGVWQVKKFVCVNKISLDEGVNVLKLSVSERRDGGVYGKLDFIKISMPKSLSGLAIESENAAVLSGERFSFTLRNSQGQKIVPDDLISYEIKVDGVGRAAAGSGFSLIGENPGVAEFTLVAVGESETCEVKGSFYVTGETGLWIDNAEKSGNRVSFTLNSLTDYAGGDKVFVAAFGYDGKNVTSASEVIMQDLPAVAAGECAEISVELTGSDSVDLVRIFVCDNRNNARALYGKTEISK